MKKHFIKLISAILVLVLSILAFSSCGLIIVAKKYPEGYTGGFGITRGTEIEYYWVETYEEVLEAIGELESYGSTFTESAFFSYEGDLFDTKYCFIFNGKMHSAKKGKKPSERWAENIEIRAYGFFEEVSIAELEYSLIENYDVVQLKPTHLFYSSHNEGEPIDRESLTYYVYDANDYFWISISQGDAVLFHIKRSKKYEYKKISDECLNSIMNSMVFVGKDDPYYSEN